METLPKIPQLNNPEAEQAVLGALLIDPTTIEEVVDFLKPADFYQDKHAEIYRACLELHRNKKPIDLVTLSDHLETSGKLGKVGGVGYLSDLAAAVPTASNIKTYARTVTDYATRRRLDKAVELTKVNIYNPQKDTGELLVEAENAILEATQRPDAEKLRPESDTLDDFLGEVETRKEYNASGRFVGLTTGFKHLDEVTLGLQTGLWIVGAEPSVGKTTFIRQLVDQVATNNPDTPCLLVSYEQSRWELTLKTISRYSRVDTRAIQKGRLSEDGERRVNEAIDRYSRHASAIYIYEGDAKTSVDVIKAKARQILKRHNAKKLLIALDFLQLIPPADGVFIKTDKERLDRVCSDLRRLARDLDSPIVAVSSLNRPSYKTGGKVGLASFKESGGIEYTADIAAGMEWNKDESQALTRERGKAMRKVYLRILKNRNGERGEIIFEFDLPLATFTEVDKRALEEDIGIFED